jgi:hypothetical protein
VLNISDDNKFQRVTSGIQYGNRLLCCPVQSAGIDDADFASADVQRSVRVTEEKVIDELGLQHGIYNAGIVAVRDDGQLVIEREFALLITTSDADVPGIFSQRLTIPIVVTEDEHCGMTCQRVEDILAANIATVNEVFSTTGQEKLDRHHSDFRVPMRIT